MVSYKKTDLVDISYPKITGWSDTEKQEEWNTYFENTAKEAAGEMTGDTEEMNLGANDSVVLTYTVQEQTKDMLSLTCQSYYDYEGSAHPSAALTSVNINMKTGEKMTFSDFADHPFPSCSAQHSTRGTGSFSESQSRYCTGLYRAGSGRKSDY